MYAILSAGVRDLLLEDGRACLPGIGTLIVEEQPALISLMESRAVPPSALLSFNENLIVDDGRLQQYLLEHEEDPDLIARLGQQLSGGRTVLLEGIGKLYYGGKKEVRFTPFADNFSKANFGLPTVKLSPIVRKEKIIIAGPVKPRQNQRAARQPKIGQTESKPSYQKWLGIVALLLLVFTAGYFVLRSPDPVMTAPRVANDLPPVDAARIGPEEAPRLDNQAAVIPAEAVAVAIPIEVADTAIIAIGLYGRQRNVNKVVARLAEAGYLPYTDRVGRNTRVGTKVAYLTDEALRNALAEVRNKFAPEAFVMRVNGNPRRPK